MKEALLPSNAMKHWHSTNNNDGCYHNIVAAKNNEQITDKDKKCVNSDVKLEFYYHLV